MRKFWIIGVFFMLLIIVPRMTSCVVHNDGGEDIPIIHGGVEE